MKKASVSVLAIALLFISSYCFSEESTTAKTEVVTTTQTTTQEPNAIETVVATPAETPVIATQPFASEQPVVDEAPVQSAPVAVESPVETQLAPVTTKETEISENVEFVSGEVSSIDAAAKTVTVKLYGEADDKAGDKVITVKVDESTDITDGDKDRDLGSLSTGTEVDVEYDPASNKATYIFVY